ncbi:MAG: DSD1 family PLP-dependent enzyme [Chloroflexota bacterium]
MFTYVPPIGAPKSEIDTPALLINHEALDRNIAKMSAFMRGTSAKLRPHSKTHKSAQIAQKQIAAGAVGITCAKLGEAEALADGGIGDILIANQIIGPIKIARLVELARRCQIAVAVDQADNVRALSEAASAADVTIRCLVEVNVGMNRCGVEPGEPALALARQVAESKGLTFGGIQAYEGHLQNLMPFAERKARVLTDMQKAVDTKHFIESHGLRVPVISGSGTGTYMVTASRMPDVNEIQAGSYATNDATYKAVGADFENALTLLVTVISRPTPDIAVIDAGMKAMTHEFGMPTVTVEGATIKSLSEEHGKLAVTGAASDLRVGDKIEIIPSHGCTTINLHDNFYVMEDERLMDVWKIVGRGKFQ